MEPENDVAHPDSYYDSTTRLWLHYQKPFTLKLGWNIPSMAV